MNLSDKEKHPYLVLGLRNHCSRSRGEKHNNGERQKLLKAPLLRGKLYGENELGVQTKDA